MKFKTFRNLVLLGVLVFFVAVGAGLYFAARRAATTTPPAQSPANAPATATAAAATADAPQPSPLTPLPEATKFTPVESANASPSVAQSAPGIEPSAAAADPAGIPLRPMDEEILRRAGEPISGDKVKDAFPGKSYKVNLYKDQGQSRVNRLKIDLDRDEKWDEKWTFVRSGDRDEVKRAVSPADDDSSYTEEYRLRAGRWVRK